MVRVIRFIVVHFGSTNDKNRKGGRSTLTECPIKMPAFPVLLFIIFGVAAFFQGQCPHFCVMYFSERFIRQAQQQFRMEVIITFV